MTHIKIGGWVKLSTCDFPSRLVSTVFAQGCPLRCVYCHNPDLINNATEGSVDWESVVDFMKTRKGLLDGIVFSGGEPMRQKEVIAAARDIKEMGFLVGVHTSGVYPQRIEAMIEDQLLDWVGLDIKSALNRYQPVVGSIISPEKIMRSWNALKDSHVDTEIRTTIHPSFTRHEDIDSIIELLVAQNHKEWIIQKARSEGSTLDLEWKDLTLVEYCRMKASAADLYLTVR